MLFVGPSNINVALGLRQYLCLKVPTFNMLPKSQSNFFITFYYQFLYNLADQAVNL